MLAEIGIGGDDILGKIGGISSEHGTCLHDLGVNLVHIFPVGSLKSASISLEALLLLLGQ